MFIDMILKAIPRSVRAGIALVITLIFFPAGLQALSQVLTSPDPSGWMIIQCVGGLLIGAAAGVAFYYFQELDGKPKEYQGLEVLGQYHQEQANEWRLRETKITHAYPPQEPENTKADTK